MRSTLLVLLVFTLAVAACSSDDKEGAAVVGTSGSCYDELADLNADGAIDTADCIWEALCPGPAGSMEDGDGDGAVTLEDCRALLRGETGDSGPTGDPGDDGASGGSCWDGLGDQDGDGDEDSWDCVWAAVCPGSAAFVPDYDEDGDVDLDDCRELFRGPGGRNGEPGEDGLGDARPNGDADGDEVENAADNCTFVRNPEQSDVDLDGAGDACDFDDDGDTVRDVVDNCPAVSNPGQHDLDEDQVGDACDPDDDNDQVTDPDDNCPRTFNPGQGNLDEDDLGDACDPDQDGDGFSNEQDNCPAAANPGQPDADADGFGDVCDEDSDGDGVLNEDDTCPLLPVPEQEDTDDDGMGDACDDDDDNDDVLDVDDNCPFHPNNDQLDTDENGDGDACDDDLDGDGFLNEDDCEPEDPGAYPGSPRPDLCDTIDDDCDGEIDEDHPVRPCSTDIPGISAAGDVQCINGVEACAQREQAGDEQCDGADRDCDGDIDNDDRDCGPNGVGTVNDPYTARTPPPNCQNYRRLGSEEDAFYRMSNGIRFCELSVAERLCLSPQWGEVCVVRSDETRAWEHHCPNWQDCPAGSHVAMNIDFRQSPCATTGELESGLGAYTDDVFYFDENSGRACSSGPNSWGNCNANGCNSEFYGGPVDPELYRGDDRHGGVRSVGYEAQVCDRGNVCVRDW